MWAESSGDRLRARTTWLLLALILASALGVRLWYASYRLDAGRFWDERYALQNVYAILNQGTLQPSSSYYPSPVFTLPAAAVLGASEGLHEMTGRPGFDVVWGTRLRPTGYLLVRGLQCLFGTTAVLVMFLLARTLLSRAASLVAALILAFMPWQIHASGYFKPDELLVLTTLLALYWSVRAMLRPGWGRAALAGWGIALAASAKLTGVLTAVPLTIGLVVLARSERKRLLELLLAGATAAASFVLMNPYWRAYPAWAASLKDDYAMRARWRGMTPWQMPARTLEFLADPYSLGIAGAILAVAGMVVLIAALWRIKEPAQRAASLALVSFPVLWVGVYALQTPYFKPNNMLPITPVMTLSLAAMLTAAWKLARSRWPRLGTPAVTALAIAALAWLWVRPGMLYAYDTVTPSTLEAISRRLQQHGVLAAGRIVVHEPDIVPARWRGGRLFEDRAAVVKVENLTEAPAEMFEGADAVVATARRMIRGDVRQALDRIVSSPHRQTVRVNPGFGKLRGPALVAELAVWKRVDGPLQLPLTRCGEDCWSSVVPRIGDPGGFGSIGVWLKTRPFRDAEPPRLLLEGRELALFPATAHPRARYYGTARFPLADDPLQLRIEGGNFAGRIAVALHRWLPPDDGSR